MSGARGQQAAYRGAFAVVVGSAAALVGYPLARLAWTVWVETGGDIAGALAGPGLATALRNTLLLAVVVTAAAVPLGALVALGLRRPDLPARGLWRLAVLLPMLVPDFVLAYSWSRAYGRAGFTDSVAGLGWEGLLGPAGVGVVLVVNAVPLAYLLVAVGLATRAEPDLERAAAASGARPWTVLRTVTLPLLRPSLAAAAVLVFVLTLGAFAIPLVLGRAAGFSTVTTRIYANLSLGADPAAFVEAVILALLLVVLAAAVVLPADAVLGPRLRVRRPASVQHAEAGRSRGAGRWVAAGLAGYTLLTLLLPLTALVAAAVTRAVGLPPAPENWTLQHFRDVVTPRTLEAFTRSVVLSVVAATALVALGVCVAVLERRRPGRWVPTLVTLTLVLPGSTLAVALVIGYGRVLGGTALILLAYLAKLWAFAHRPVSGALDRLPPDELHAARSSGATLPVMLRTVALRPLLPALAAGWTVCFLTAMHEVTMSSLLYGPGGETLAVVVLNTQELGRVGPTAALSVLLTLVLAAPAVLLWWTLRRARGALGSAVSPVEDSVRERAHVG